MAIMFKCKACSEAIEVDDEWATKPVQCPFCQAVVTAPTTSGAPDATAEPPEMMPAMMPPAASESWSPASTGGQAVPPRPRNTIAIVALVLACLAVVQFLIMGMTYGVKLAAVVTADMSSAEIMEAARQLVDEAVKNGESWVIVMAILVVTGVATWLGGLVCAIIAATRRSRRGLTIAAFVVLVSPLLMSLVSR